MLELIGAMCIFVSLAAMFTFIGVEVKRIIEGEW